MVKATAGGPDNNKRLAELEAGVSALAIVVATAVGVGVETISDPIAAAKGAIESMKAHVTELEEQYKTREGTIGEIEKERDELRVTTAAQADAIKAYEAAAPVAIDAIDAKITEALTHAGIEIPEGGNPVDAAVTVIEDWRSKTLNLAEAVVAGEHELLADEGPHAAAVRILSAEPGGATQGEIVAIERADKAEARVAELEQLIADGRVGGEVAADPEPPRDSPRETGETLGQCDADDILAFIQEGATFELVLSDGKAELLAFPGLTLTGRELHRVGERYGVVPGIHAKVASGDPVGAQEIHGAALLVHGEQVSYCPLERPQTVNPGEERAFRGVFTFG